MTPVRIAFVVLGIVALVAIIVRRMSGGPGPSELAPGDRPVLGPERASYRGSTGALGRHATGTATVVLTERQIVFRPLLGAAVTIERQSIRGVREQASFLGSSDPSHPCIVLTLDTGEDVGFLVANPAPWMAALRA